MHEPDPPRRLVLFGPADCLNDDGVEAAVRGAEAQGWNTRRVEVQEDAAEAQLREAVGRAALLVTFGGDGSLHMAANAVLAEEADVVLGLVPTGTGNDFARHLGLVDAQPGDSLERLLGWPERRIDVMAVPRPTGRPLRSVNAVSFGAIAGTTQSTPEIVKTLAGKTAYAAWGAAIAAVADGTQVRITGRRPDGSAFSWSGPALGVIAGNGRFTGGGFHVAPAARLASGRFELLVIPELPLHDRYDLSRRLHQTDGGEPEADLAGWPPEPLVAASLVELRVEADEALPLNTDGESSEARTLEVAIQPEALRMRVPEEA